MRELPRQKISQGGAKKMIINPITEKKRVIAHLKALNLLDKIDNNLIDIYVENLKEYWDHVAYFKENSKTIDTYNADGITLKYAQQHPKVSFMKENWAVVVQISKEFGLTPKSRAGIKIEKVEKKEGKVQKLMRKKNDGNRQGFQIRSVSQ